MAKITIWGYVTACDPGINNLSSYKGSIDVSDLKPEQDLTVLPDDSWWKSEIAYKFGKLTFVELRPDGALFRYGEREILAPYGADKNKRVDEVGLSYAYAEIYVQVEQ